MDMHAQGSCSCIIIGRYTDQVLDQYTAYYTIQLRLPWVVMCFKKVPVPNTTLCVMQVTSPLHITPVPYYLEVVRFRILDLEGEEVWGLYIYLYGLG